MNLRSLISLAVLALGGLGCAHVAVVAPHGQEVYLLPASAPAEVERRWHTWFLVWGYTPFDDTMPAEYMQREDFSQVRVIVEDNVPDALHAILYNVVMPFGLVPQTVVIEGNRPPPRATTPVTR